MWSPKDLQNCLTRPLGPGCRSNDRHCGKWFLPSSRRGPQRLCSFCRIRGVILFSLFPGHRMHRWVLPILNLMQRPELVSLSSQLLYGNFVLHPSECSSGLVDGVNQSVIKFVLCHSTTVLMVQIFHDFTEISLYFKDVYLHVPIHPSHWQFLQFAFRNSEGDIIVYQWKVLPFGLPTIPRMFTKLLGPVVALLHLQGYLMYPYIDDIFHAHSGILQPGASYMWPHLVHSLQSGYLS